VKGVDAVSGDTTDDLWRPLRIEDEEEDDDEYDGARRGLAIGYRLLVIARRCGRGVLGAA
jgi:hypothetical protein